MYEPEVSTFFSQAISWAFFIILIGGGIAGWLNAKPLKTPDILTDLANDRIQIGYIDDNISNEVNIVVSDEDEITTMKRQIELLKLKKELKSLQQEDSIDDSFFKECVNAMIALGEKNTEAKKRAREILIKNPKINTVDSFIQQVYKS